MMENRKQHIVPQGYPLWVGWYEVTWSGNDDVDRETVEHFAHLTDEGVLYESAVNCRLVVGWTYTDGGVAEPFTYDIGMDDGRAFIGLTKAEVHAQVASHVQFIRDLARQMLKDEIEVG